MAEKRLILEMGTGNDLYGEDYTKAAIRAVQDCLHHSSLSLYKSLDLDPTKMVVTVTIGVQKPDEVDTDAVAKQLPYGTVTVTAVMGGLNVPDEANNQLTVVAAAAVEARYDIPEGRFRLVGLTAAAT